MTCPLCGYAMSAFDKECPRCHGKGAGASAATSPTLSPPSPAPPPFFGDAKDKRNASKSLFAIIFVSVALALSLSKCGVSDDQSQDIVGTWRPTTALVELQRTYYASGRLEIEVKNPLRPSSPIRIQAAYSVRGDELHTEAATPLAANLIFHSRYQIDGATLTLTRDDGTKLYFHRGE